MNKLRRTCQGAIAAALLLGAGAASAATELGDFCWDFSDGVEMWANQWSVLHLVGPHYLVVTDDGNGSGTARLIGSRVIINLSFMDTNEDETEAGHWRMDLDASTLSGTFEAISTSTLTLESRYMHGTATFRRCPQRFWPTQ